MACVPFRVDRNCTDSPQFIPHNNHSIWHRHLLPKTIVAVLFLSWHGALASETIAMRMKQVLWCGPLGTQFFVDRRRV